MFFVRLSLTDALWRVLPPSLQVWNRWLVYECMHRGVHGGVRLCGRLILVCYCRVRRGDVQLERSRVVLAMSRW